MTIVNLILIGQIQAETSRDNTANYARARSLLNQFGVVQLPRLAERSMPPSELTKTTT